MAFGKEGAEARHLRFGQPEQVAHRSGLLTEPESRQRPEIDESGIYQLSEDMQTVDRRRIIDRLSLFLSVIATLSSQLLA